MAGPTVPSADAAPRDVGVARPAVSVVLPFHGDADDARETRAALAGIALRPGDEVVVADNTPEGVFAALEVPDTFTVVRARDEQSSYHSRNVAADRARHDWLLFLDADCLPPATIIDDYFATPPEAGAGALVGEVVGRGDQDSLVPRYSRSRGHLGQEPHVNFFYRPFGVTANMLVRRKAWESVGGFQEGVRSAGDAEFSWRLQDAGWELQYAPQAAVEHRHRETVRQLARQAARYGAGRAWINRRYPGSHSRPKLLRRLGRCAAGVVVWTVTGRRERAKFKALDAVFIVSECVAYFLPNRPPPVPGRPAADPAAPAPPAVSLVVWADIFPALSETFVTNEVRALREAHHHVRVEAGARPGRPERAAARALPITYLEDDSIAEKLRDLLWLVARHPVRCLRDLRERRRWAREEEVWPLLALAAPARRMARAGERHVHAHFAGISALNALRVSRLLGTTYSVATHGYDIFMRPRNLVEKHRRAAFAVTDCEYSLDYLRELVGPPDAERIHEVVLGVDGASFQRSTPPPGGRHVVTVARLVEKKGLPYLVAAAARARVDRVTVVGDGPLRAELEAQVHELGLEGVVDLPGWSEPAEVRALLETADLLALPCVVAANGDRDTMPVVVKEALAMEVPVVATDEVGLPEVVRPGWGRLVPPRDAEALAAAIDELLDLPLEERAAMGRAGREWVLERFDVRREAERLAGLVAAAAR